MRAIRRHALSAETLQFLQQSRTDKVLSEPLDAQRAQVKALWRYQNNKAFKEIRETLTTMASGRARCMYCEDSAGTDIEHFWPKSQYPQRAFLWENYLWACSHCNSNQKRAQFPLDTNGQPLLLNPCDDEPTEHLVYVPSTGEYQGQTQKGRTSVTIFGLNDTSTSRSLPQGRKDVFLKLQLMLEAYAGHLVLEQVHKADEVRRVVRREPFASVLVWLLKIAQTPLASVYIRPACQQALKNHGEIASWSM